MGRSRLGAALAALVLLGLAGCDDSDSEARSNPTQTSASTTAPAPASPYTSLRFLPRLTVAPPPWLPPAPAVDDPHFLTWAGRGADVDRAVRFMSPIGIYDPGHHPNRLSPVPGDYLRYFLTLRRYGAQLTDRSGLQVDGHPATLLTARTDTSLSGSIGCQADVDPESCYGPQPSAYVRIAVLEVDGSTVLAWARTLPGSPTADQDFAGFEALLGTVRFD